MRALLLTVTLLALAGCGGEDKASGPDASAADAGSSSSAEESATVAEAPPPNPLDAGTYCYFRDDENVTEALEIVVADNGLLSGENYGNIHQEAAGYYASFTTELSNGVQGPGNDVTFDHVTEVDGDTQRGKVMWQLTTDSAAPDGLETLLEQTDCDGLQDKVFPPVDEQE